MLSSLILSMAMSASPAPVIESDSLIINEIGRLRGTVKINDQKLDIDTIGRLRGTVKINDQKLDVDTIGRLRGTVKINDQKLDVDTIGRLRGTVKIQESNMINLFKALFVTKAQNNPIASSIEIKEMPASVWWK